MKDFLMNHHILLGFLIGLIIGLVGIIFVWIQGLNKRRLLAKEIKQLRNHLQTQMEIQAKGNQSTLAENEQLKKQCENMRITIATLKSKPGRSELQTLQIYDKAIHLMYEKAPGFAPAWEAIIKEAEADIQQTDTGLKALLRKVVRPALADSSQSRETESASGDSSQIDLLQTNKK
jgi:AAA15 family ATPase/GTPase